MLSFCARRWQRLFHWQDGRLRQWGHRRNWSHGRLNAGRRPVKGPRRLRRGWHSQRWIVKGRCPEPSHHMAANSTAAHVTGAPTARLGLSSDQGTRKQGCSQSNRGSRDHLVLLRVRPDPPFASDGAPALALQKKIVRHAAGVFDRLLQFARPCPFRPCNVFSAALPLTFGRRLSGRPARRFGQRELLHHIAWHGGRVANDEFRTGANSSRANSALPSLLVRLRNTHPSASV
jgi:hypothetical protein